MGNVGYGKMPPRECDKQSCPICGSEIYISKYRGCVYEKRN